MASQRDYYEVLSVSRTATEKVIAGAYRQIAIQNHPDSNQGDDEATERFKEAAEAYEVLGDQEKRARYDRYGHAGVSNGGGRAHQSAEDIFEAFGDMFGGAGGIFGDIFGGGGRRRGGRRQRQGANVKVEVTLDLEEAAKGVNKTIEFDRSEKCDSCQGSGSRPGSSPETCSRCRGQGQVVQSAGILRVQTTCPSCRGSGSVISDPCAGCRGKGFVARARKIDVAIPAGVDSGMQVRVPGEGEPSPDGGPPGDCYCFIVVREHSLFERDGEHLILRLPMTYPQAALGAEVQVPTLDGTTDLTIPPGTQSGDVFRIHGRGLADPRHGGKGDMLVQAFIEVPKKLPAEQETLLRQLAELEHSQVSPHRKSFLEKLKDYFVAGDTHETVED